MNDGTASEQSLLAELRIAARGLMDAEEAYRRAPSLENQSLLARARRRVGDALAVEPSR